MSGMNSPRLVMLSGFVIHQVEHIERGEQIQGIELVAVGTISQRQVRYAR